jgi:hypothetical protein
MKEALRSKDKDLDMEIIGLLQELTGICKTLTLNQSQMIKMQSIILDQITAIGLSEFPEEYCGRS